MDFTNYINCYWGLIITMATVGYGDYYPRTVIGRIVIVFGGLSGVVIVSLLVIALNNYVDMDSAEKKAHNVNTRLIERRILKNEAAWILTINGRIKYMRKHSQGNYE